MLMFKEILQKYRYMHLFICKIIPWHKSASSDSSTSDMELLFIIIYSNA